MKYKLAAILFLIFLSLPKAQLPPSQKVVKIDSALTSGDGLISADSLLSRDYRTENEIWQRNFRPDFKKKYRSKAFDYDVIKPKISLWQRLSNYLENLIRKLFGKGYNQQAGRATLLVLKILSIVICGFLVYLLLNFLLRNDGRLFFGKKNRKTALRADDLAEDIHEINFSEAIAAAEAARDYRSAVRYRFLKVLKELSDRQMIRWNPEKTNQDYSRELKDAATAEKFRKLARIYDYVWYGEFEISENDYAFLRRNFEENTLKP